jgi:hypothetical protein
MYVFINENPNHYFIILPKFRGKTCERDIFKQRLWSGYMFLKRQTYIQICRGEIAGMLFYSIQHLNLSPFLFKRISMHYKI